MADRSYVRASRRRGSAAAFVDVAASGGLWWLVRRRELVGSDGAVARLFALPHELVRQQLRTPGQLLLGIRTVDRRTGVRVAMWRTLVLAGAELGGRELIRRLAVPESPARARERRAVVDETHEIYRNHPRDSPERVAALREVSARYPLPHARGLGRVMIASLLVGLLNLRLRRRLAPTVEVLARGG